MKVSKLLFINFQLFTIFLLILFFIAINLGLASHETNFYTFLCIYLIFSGVHLGINFFIIKKGGGSLFYIFVSSTIILIGYMVVWLLFTR